MNKKEKSEYLDRWGSSCMICGSHVERKDMELFQSVQELKRYPVHGNPEYVLWYMACPQCVEDGELL